MKISFIGVGVMGGGMCRNLLKKGLEVRAIARKKEHLIPFQQAGAAISTRNRDAADSSVIFFCLPDGAAVRQVLLGEEGLLECLAPGTILVDCSTLSYLEAQELAESCREREVAYLDAPISGHQAKADDGTLTIMVGGEEEAFLQVKPLLEVVGSTILYMGESGSGQLTKMINNCCLNICTAAFCELMPLGAKLGLSPEKLGKVLMTASGSSYASCHLIPKVLEGDFAYGFSLARAYKDMAHMAELTTRFQVPLPTLQGTMQTYQLALRHGEGDLYKGAMIRFYEDLLGVECRREPKEPLPVER